MKSDSFIIRGMRLSASILALLLLAGLTSRSAGAADPVPARAHTAPFRGWTPVGAPYATGLYAPVAGVNADGRQELFALEDTNPVVWHAWQNSPNGSWSDWALHDYMQALCLAVRPNADGRMELFALGSNDHVVYHTWQGVVNGPFAAGWTSFGYPFVSIQLNCPLVVGQHADGRLNLFAFDSDSRLWKLSQTAPSNGWGSWDWIYQPDGVSLSSPAWGFDSSGRQFIFARASDGSIYVTYQTAFDGFDWTAWQSFGQPAGVSLSAPAVSWNEDMRMEVFAMGDDGNLWHSYQTAPSAGWTSWDSMGKPAGVALQPYTRPLVGRYDIDGTGKKMEVFVQDYNGNFYHRGQATASDGWGNWAALGQPTYASGVHEASAGRNADGSLVLFTGGNDGLIWQNRQGARLLLPLIRR